jgi:hypothetical protein
MLGTETIISLSLLLVLQCQQMVMHAAPQPTGDDINNAFRMASGWACQGDATQSGSPASGFVTWERCQQPIAATDYTTIVFARITKSNHQAVAPD